MSLHSPKKAPKQTHSPERSGLDRFLTKTRMALLLIWGALTIHGVVLDEDTWKGEFMKADRKRNTVDMKRHWTDHNGIRRILEPGYVSVSAPETIDHHESFVSPQFYARKFDMGESIDKLSHEKLVGLIKDRMGTYIMSTIYGESFLENDYLHDSNQRSFNYRIKRITFKASSSPEALIHDFASVFVGNTDPENEGLAKIRLETFKAAFKDACQQLNVTFEGADTQESTQETQLNASEEAELKNLAQEYPGGGKAFLADYNAYCQQIWQGVTSPVTAIPVGVMERLHRILGDKRNVSCELEFTTEKGHIFLVPFYWLAFLLPLVTLRRWYGDRKKTEEGAEETKDPDASPVVSKIPKGFTLPPEDYFATKKIPRTRDPFRSLQVLNYRYQHIHLIHEIFLHKIMDLPSGRLVLTDLDPLHYPNLSLEDYYPRIYIDKLGLGEEQYERIVEDAKDGRSVNILLYILAVLKRYGKALPSAEMLLEWIDIFYLNYYKIPPFGSTTSRIPSVPLEAAPIESILPVEDIAPVEDTLPVEDIATSPKKAVAHTVRKTKGGLANVLNGVYIDTSSAEANKYIYQPRKAGNPGRETLKRQHDQQYNKFRADNQAKGRYNPETGTGRGKNSRTGRGTRPMASNARSSKQNRHSPAKKK